MVLKLTVKTNCTTVRMATVSSWDAVYGSKSVPLLASLSMIQFTTGKKGKEYFVSLITFYSYYLLVDIFIGI